MKPLITLAMIVKDEADTIRKTLESAKPFIDRWAIADTGSSDGTKDIVTDAMVGVPGKIIDIEFGDFSTARNLALDACGTETEFILMLDAEDVLVGGDALRMWLKYAIGSLYNLTIRSGPFRWSSARVSRSGSGCMYVGKVHELLVGQDGTSTCGTVTDVEVVHERSPKSHDRTMRRHMLDIELLSQSAENDSRSAFYLARALDVVGMSDDALAAYERRVSMGGWTEEVYCSLAHMGWIKEKFGRPWSEVMDLYLRAHDVAPHRSETLYEIARHYNEEKRHALCVLFASRGLCNSKPGLNCLFVDDDIYKWKLFDIYASSAYWIGEYDMGELYAKKACAAKPDDARMRVNLAHYETRRQRLGHL